MTPQTETIRIGPKRILAVSLVWISCLPPRTPPRAPRDHNIAASWRQAPGLLRGAIDVHEHLGDAVAGRLLLEEMHARGVRRVVVLGSGRRVLTGMGGIYEDVDENNAFLLRFAAKARQELAAFVAVDPRDARALEKLRAWIGQGASGVKLYAGHGAYHSLALDGPKLDGILGLAAARSIPVVFHVNGMRYADELARALDRHPRLHVNCPHLCLLLGDLPRLDRLLRRHPKLWIDISFGAYAVQAFSLMRRMRLPLRRLLLRYARRLLFGADRVLMRYDDRGDLSKRWDAYLAFLFSETFRYEGRVYRGLSLPLSLRHQILVANGRRFLGPARR